MKVIRLCEERPPGEDGWRDSGRWACGLVGPNQGRQDVVKGQRSGALYHEGLRHLETDINLEFK